jgi:hypothetical protein
MGQDDGVGRITERVRTEGSDGAWLIVERARITCAGVRRRRARPTAPMRVPKVPEELAPLASTG